MPFCQWLAFSSVLKLQHTLWKMSSTEQTLALNGPLNSHDLLRPSDEQIHDELASDLLQEFTSKNFLSLAANFSCHGIRKNPNYVLFVIKYSSSFDTKYNSGFCELPC